MGYMIILMSERVVELLEEVWASIGSFCSTLTAEQWALPTDCPGWSVKDNLAHIIGTERMLLGEASPELVGDPPSYVHNDIGRFNQAWVDSRRGVSPEELLEEFQEVTARRLLQLSSFSPEHFNQVGPSPVGEVSYREFMNVRVFDCWVHEQDMRRAVGEPGDLTGPVAELAFWRAASAMPYVVGKRVKAPDGSVILFDINGPLVQAFLVRQEQGRAHLVPNRSDVRENGTGDASTPRGSSSLGNSSPMDTNDDGEGGSSTTASSSTSGGEVVMPGSASEPYTPRASLTMGSEVFCMLSCGRISADQALRDGLLQLGGDLFLANAVANLMNIMI